MQKRGNPEANATQSGLPRLCAPRKALDDQLAAINTAIATFVQSGKLAAEANILQAIPGVGAVMCATKHNPSLKIFYQRLIANGKKPIVALTATMRKLITIANAKIRVAQLSW